MWFTRFSIPRLLSSNTLRYSKNTHLKRHHFDISVMPTFFGEFSFCVQVKVTVLNDKNAILLDVYWEMILQNRWLSQLTFIPEQLCNLEQMNEYIEILWHDLWEVCSRKKMFSKKTELDTFIWGKVVGDVGLQSGKSLSRFIWAQYWDESWKIELLLLRSQSDTSYSQQLPTTLHMCIKVVKIIHFLYVFDKC